MNSIQHSGCHSVQKILSKWLLTSFLTTTLGYSCIWIVVLILVKHAPHSKNDISEDSEVNNCLEKYILLALWRMRSRLQVFLRPSKIESDLITSHENSLTTKYSFKMSNFGLLWRWLFWKRIKSKLFGVTCSFKERCMRARDKYSYSTVLYKIEMAPWTIVMAKHYDYGTVFEVYIWMTLQPVPWLQLFQTHYIKTFNQLPLIEHCIKTRLSLKNFTVHAKVCNCLR